jgi:hypothetical protein
MAEKTKEREHPKVEGKLPVGHPHASYVPPDLSFEDGIGEKPSEVEEWDETRDSARDEGVEAANKAEEEFAQLEAEARDESSEQAKKARDEQVDIQVKAGQRPAPTPTTEEIVAEKISGSKGGSKSTTKS